MVFLSRSILTDILINKITARRKIKPTDGRSGDAPGTDKSTKVRPGFIALLTLPG
jgi:hypothetical protein